MVGKADGGVDVVKIRSELREEKRRLEEERRNLGLEQLVHFDEKAKSDNVVRFLKASEIANKHGITIEALMALNPDSEEQMETHAKTLASMKQPTQTMTVDSALGSGGGDMSWDKVKEAYAHGKISTKDYMEARKSRFTN